MRKKILLFLLLLLLFSVNICLADEKTGETAKIGFIKEIYGYLIGIGAGLALLALIWGGIKFILAGGDPGLITEAKAWLVSGFTGLILIAAAGTIYKGINKEFPSFKIKFPTKLDPIARVKMPGVFFCDGDTPCPTIPEKEGGGRKIPDPEHCAGPYTHSIANTVIIDKKIKSIKIVNDDDSENSEKRYYGLILFPDIWYKGEKVLLGHDLQKKLDTSKESCISSKLKGVNSIAILNYSKNTTGKNLGGKVIFHQNPWYGKGTHTIQGAKIGSVLNPLEKNLAKMLAIYDKKAFLTLDEQEKIKRCTSKGAIIPCLYQSESWWKKSGDQDPRCLQSIEIIGNYAVLLERKDVKGEAGCEKYQLFFPDYPITRGPTNLSTLPLWADQSPNHVTIYPYETK